METKSTAREPHQSATRPYRPATPLIIAATSFAAYLGVMGIGGLSLESVPFGLGFPRESRLQGCHLKVERIRDWRSEARGIA